LLAAVLGSGIVALDATVVNVALPAIGRDFHAGLAGLQWTLDAYLVTLASLILIGGSLGDHFGRRRVFVIGIVWFAAASLLTGVAPNLPILIAGRALQGIGGALLTPASLAIIQSAFHPDDRAKAIGAWSGLGGVATAIGPLAGGYLIGAVSWRLIFLLNLPLSAVAAFVAWKHVPETTDPTVDHRLDFTGAWLCVIGLGGITYALIDGPGHGLGDPLVALGAAAGLLAIIGFVLTEARGTHPMLPLDIFKSRQFSSANLVTFTIYAALGGVFFLLIVFLQSVLHYSPVLAGAASLPVTFLMLVLSARAGALATRIGPRLPMTVGPLVVGVGVVLMSRLRPGDHYPTTVLPAVIVFGLGLACTVAPLTAAVLAAADVRHAGVASGVNNAVARVASLMAVALLPVLAGISGNDYRNPVAFLHGFHRAMLLSAGLVAFGGVLAWLTISDDAVRAQAPRPAETHCALDGPPLRAGRA
jgi:EmrB/QacA subfamily drug resistance transporter